MISNSVMEKDTTIKKMVVFSRTQVIFHCGLSHQCQASSTYWVIAGNFHPYNQVLSPMHFDQSHSSVHIKEGCIQHICNLW